MAIVLIKGVIVTAVLAFAGAALIVDAADAPKPAPGAMGCPGMEKMYGAQVMTPQECQAMHDKMASAKTPEARDMMCMEHHKAMQARAKERGMALDEHPHMKQHMMGEKMQPGMMGQMCGGMMK